MTRVTAPGGPVLSASSAAAAILFALAVCCTEPAKAAEKSAAAPPKSSEEAEAAYRQAIEKRVADILAVLELKAAPKVSKVHDLLIAQYRGLRDWHDTNDPRFKGMTGDETRQINSSLRTLHE